VVTGQTLKRMECSQLLHVWWYYMPGILFPFIDLTTHRDCKHILNCAIESFNQPITLRVIRCGVSLPDVQHVTHFLDYLGFKLCPHVRVKLFRESKTTKHVVNQLSQVTVSHCISRHTCQCCCWYLQWQRGVICTVILHLISGLLDSASAFWCFLPCRWRIVKLNSLSTVPAVLLAPYSCEARWENCDLFAKQSFGLRGMGGSGW